jgi:hypothetical protein
MFKNFNFVSNSNPILAGTLPDEIFLEISKFVEHCRTIKEHPLGILYNHINDGKNYYQVSIPKPLIEQSFLFPYLIKLGEYFLKTQNVDIVESKRQVRLRSNLNHFDGYDCWVNFTNTGDRNPFHYHVGSLSGVIYYSNKENCPTIFKDDITYFGKDQEILIFPAALIHCVDAHIGDLERITLSFNLDYIDYTD